MLVVLQAITNGGRSRRVQLRSDQVLKVGRSGWADFSVPDDPELLDEHFEVRCAPEGCVVRSLSTDAATHINGEAITSSLAYDGDEIQAGATKFRLAVQGGPMRDTPDEPEAETTDDEGAAAAAPVAAAALGLVGVCAYLEFADDVQQLAETADTPESLIDELTAQEKFQDALRLRAYTLEKRQAVWWGCYCLNEELDEPLPADQTAAADAAADWVKEPEESQRRAAESKAADAQFAGPGATIALSAFWSEGSLAPEGSPDVEPDERLTSQGVTAALIAAAYLGEPTGANDRLKAFLDRGRDVAQGVIALPE